MHDGFKQVVKKAWKRDNGLREKIKKFWMVAADRNKKEFSNIFHRKTILLKRF